LIVPLFKAGKILFPLEMKASKVVGLFMEQISLATKDGIKGKDDCLDTISMLNFMTHWVPTPDKVAAPKAQDTSPLWEKHAINNDPESALDSYIT